MKNEVVSIWICKGNFILKNMELIHNNKSLEDLEGEIWKDIKGYEGLYCISNLGRVKSLSKILKGRNSNRIIKEKIRTVFLNSGYLGLLLCIDKKQKRFLLHRLIAEAFVINPNKKSIVNHIDGNKTNNCIDNLEWVTIRENSCHSQLKKDLTSNHIGVHLHSKCKRWASSIFHNNKTIYLGLYKTEEEAYQSRKQFELENNIDNKYS